MEIVAYVVAKVLDYNLVYNQGLPNDKKSGIITFQAITATYKLNKPPHSSKPLPYMYIHVF